MGFDLVGEEEVMHEVRDVWNEPGEESEEVSSQRQRPSGKDLVAKRAQKVLEAEERPARLEQNKKREA